MPKAKRDQLISIRKGRERIQKPLGVERGQEDYPEQIQRLISFEVTDDAVQLLSDIAELNLRKTTRISAPVGQSNRLPQNAVEAVARSTCGTLPREEELEEIRRQYETEEEA